MLWFASHLAQTTQSQQIDSRSSVVEPDDQAVSARSIRQRVVFAVEVVHERVDDGEVEQIEVETTIVVRLHRTLNLLAVRPVVEAVLRPPQHRYRAVYPCNQTIRLIPRLRDTTRLSNRLYNRFDNRLYRVNKHPTGSPTGCQPC